MGLFEVKHVHPWAGLDACSIGTAAMGPDSPWVRPMGEGSRCRRPSFQCSESMGGTLDNTRRTDSLERYVAIFDLWGTAILAQY